MSNLNLSNAAKSDMTNILEDYSIPSQNIDGVTGQEIRYQNTDFQKQYDAFYNVADLKTALLLKAVWIIGKGFNCDPRTKVILDHIRGFGKQNFREIIFNMLVTSRIGGDAYAEIKREGDLITNLIPISPRNMVIVRDKFGTVLRYEQVSGINKKPIIWKPEEIFHISHNCLIDQAHGISDIDFKTISADEQSFDDAIKLMHRQARPMIIWKLKTGDTTKISEFISKIDQARKYGEDMFVPDDEDVATWEILQVNPSQAVFEWRNELRNKFYRTIGLPQIVPGASGQSSESEGKTIYFAFEQLCAHDRLKLENDIWSQLFLRVKFIPPSTMQADIAADEAADGNGQILAQPSDLDVRSGR